MTSSAIPARLAGGTSKRTTAHLPFGPPAAALPLLTPHKHPQPKIPKKSTDDAHDVRRTNDK